MARLCVAGVGDGPPAGGGNGEKIRDCVEDGEGEGELLVTRVVTGRLLAEGVKDGIGLTDGDGVSVASLEDGPLLDGMIAEPLVGNIVSRVDVGM